MLLYKKLLLMTFGTTLLYLAEVQFRYSVGRAETGPTDNQNVREKLNITAE